MAEEDHQQVLAAPARYPRTFADFPAHAEQRHDVGQRDEVDQAAEEAGVPYGLRVLAERVTRHEVGDDAQAHVVETAAEAVFPGHGWRLAVSGRKWLAIGCKWPAIGWKWPEVKRRGGCDWE